MGQKQYVTDLQFTMASILNDEGVSLEKGNRRCVLVENSLIRVTEAGYDGNDKFNKEYSVSIEEDSKTITIVNKNCRIEGIQSLPLFEDETRWWEYHENSIQKYQIIDGKMKYTKKTERIGSKEDSMGGGVDLYSESEEESTTYELPDGYKITDGIAIFKNMKSIDTTSKAKKI